MTSSRIRCHQSGEAPLSQEAAGVRGHNRLLSRKRAQLRGLITGTQLRPTTHRIRCHQSGATSAFSAESVELVGGLDHSRVLFRFEARHEAVEDLPATARLGAGRWAPHGATKNLSTKSWL